MFSVWSVEESEQEKNLNKLYTTEHLAGSTFPLQIWIPVNELLTWLDQKNQQLTDKNADLISASSLDMRKSRLNALLKAIPSHWRRLAPSPNENTYKSYNHQHTKYVQLSFPKWFFLPFLNYYILHKSKSRINQRLVGTKGCLTSVWLFSGAWAHSMVMVCTVV